MNEHKEPTLLEWALLEIEKIHNKNPKRLQKKLQLKILHKDLSSTAFMPFYLKLIDSMETIGCKEIASTTQSKMGQYIINLEWKKEPNKEQKDE